MAKICGIGGVMISRRGRRLPCATRRGDAGNCVHHQDFAGARHRRQQVAGFERCSRRGRLLRREACDSASRGRHRGLALLEKCHHVVGDLLVRRQQGVEMHDGVAHDRPDADMAILSVGNELHRGILRSGPGQRPRRICYRAGTLASMRGRSTTDGEEFHDAIATDVGCPDDGRRRHRGRRACVRIAGGGPRLSEEAHRACRAVRGRRHHRQYRPDDLAAPDRALGATAWSTIALAAAARSRPRLSRRRRPTVTRCWSPRSALRSHQPCRNCPTIDQGLCAHHRARVAAADVGGEFSLPVTTLQEFIAFAKSKPDGLDYASSGMGTSPHLAGEMFKAMSGVNLVHVRSRATPRSPMRSWAGM